jgi:hypothetical protein
MYRCIGVLAGLVMASAILSFINDDLKIHIWWINILGLDLAGMLFGMIIGHIADK